MSESPETPRESSTGRIGAWLRSDVTLTLPGWAFALGAASVLLLLGVALD